MQGVKVLSIFGNTGDGKSHTLNHILFGGDTIFYTSKSPSSCTVGVWAAFDPGLGLVALDTEGLLGAAANQNQRMRLLLKVLAVSDVVVYRTLWGRRSSYSRRPPTPSYWAMVCTGEAQSLTCNTCNHLFLCMHYTTFCS